MKKSFFFALSAILLLLVSCEGPMGPQGPVGPQGPAGEGTTWKVAYCTVAANQWNYSNFNNNNYFYARFNIPELTSFCFTDGQVQAYIQLLENNETIQHNLPYVLHNEYFPTDTTVYFYTRTIDCVFGVGWVQFEVRDSDFEYEVDETINPDEMTFRVVMTY